MEWTNEDVLIFLEYYERESVIWNAGHADHKNRNLVYDAWKRIEFNMGRRDSIAEMKKKEDSLMASFRTYQNKVKEAAKSGAGTDELYKPNWFAFEKMFSFIKYRNEPRNTINSENLTLQLLQGEKTMNDENSEEINPMEGASDNNTEIVDNNDIEEIPWPSTRKVTFKAPIQEKKVDGEEVALKRKMDEAFLITQSNAQKKEKQKDFCDKYGEIVAEKLRCFDERTMDIAMNQIDNLLFQMKINPNMSTQYQQNIPTHTNLSISSTALPQRSSQASYGSKYSETLSQAPSPYESSSQSSDEPVYETIQQCYTNFPMSYNNFR